MVMQKLYSNVSSEERNRHHDLQNNSFPNLVELTTGALRQFASPSDDKLSIWRAYELMEFREGNLNAAQSVYQRSIRDTIVKGNGFDDREKNIRISNKSGRTTVNKDTILQKSKEVEVSRWKTESESSFGESSVWMNDGSIEGKVPSAAMQKKNMTKKMKKKLKDS